MNFLSLVLLSLGVAASDDWKTSFLENRGKERPISGVSRQCASDTETWQRSLELVAEVSVECLVTRNCSKSETVVIKENLYALEQLDAWGKLPLTGLFQVPLLFDGSYQECERISGKKYETNYCYMVLLPGKNATCHQSNGDLPSVFLRSAVCMPMSCSSDDLPSVYNQISSMPVTACAAYCSTFPVEKDSAFWGFSSFLAVIIAIVILATSVDYIRESLACETFQQNLPLRILFAFSIWMNAELLLSVKEQKRGFIKCLDCIRFFSMLWVVTGHTFTYLMVPDQLLTITKFFTHYWNHLILNAFLSVDTFFLLSGIVVAYLFFKQRPKISQIKSPITWVLFYLHRYLRLTPPFMIFIGFFVVYGMYIQGPAAASQLNQLVPQVQVCARTWWRNALYINNLDSDTDMCYGISWYLGADTQMYVVAPIILVAFYFSFAAGILLITAGCVGSIITVYILYSQFDFPADFFGIGKTDHFYDVIYDKPWIRCPPYLIGLLVGYCLATYGNRKFRLNWVLAVTGWLVALGIAAACIFSTYDYDKHHYWSVFARATFYNFSRLGWSVAVSWVIVANHMGWGGPVNAFMSHPMWQPFGRLSYCAYIVHFVVLYWYLNINGASIHFYSTFQIFIYYSVPSTLLSYLFAFFWSCLFEIPVLKLEKMLIEAIIGSSGRTSGKVGDVEQRPDIRTEDTAQTTQLWEVEEASKTKCK